MGGAEGKSGFEAGRPLFGIDFHRQPPVVLDHRMAGAEGGAEIDAQAQVGRTFGSGGEFLRRLVPGAIEQRGDRQGGGDAVADQLRKGVTLLEGQFLRRIHLHGPGLDIVARPDAALLPAGCVIEAENAGIEIGERVEIDEARTDQRLAVIDATGDRAVVTVADEEDALTFEHHFAVFIEDVAAVAMADDPAGG